MTEKENLYLYQDSRVFNSDSHIEEIHRLWSLAGIGSLVRIQLNGPGSERSMEWESQKHIGKIGVITRKYSIPTSNFIVSVLLGSGVLLERVHILDFVVIQPVGQQEEEAPPKKSGNKKTRRGE
ncbi:MAG: hypothetical protein E6R04_05710 [Spirochaetes bacterium]|nr:MAG: hypothetical protein E6R04_05710 [Spirochaetota bacterium]